MKIAISNIQPSQSTQARVSIDEPTVQRYTSHFEADGEFPAIDVFFDGSKHWLADGWHRLIAAQRAGKAELHAQVHTGTERDAMVFALGANATHGLPRSSADKRRAVEMALADKLLCELSSREVATICKVSHNLVAEMRKGMSSDDSTQKRKQSSSDDKKPKPAAQDLPPAPEPEPHGVDDNEELRNAIQELSEENSKLRDAIAVGRLSVENQQTAADIIKSLREKLKQYEVANSALTTARDQAMNEVAELKAQCARYQRELKKYKGQ